MTQEEHSKGLQELLKEVDRLSLGRKHILGLTVRLYKNENYISISDYMINAHFSSINNALGYCKKCNSLEEFWQGKGVIMGSYNHTMSILNMPVPGENHDKNS